MRRVKTINFFYFNNSMYKIMFVDFCGQINDENKEAWSS